MSKPSSDEIRSAVIERYGAIARRYREGSGKADAETGCCGSGASCCGDAASPAEEAGRVAGATGTTDAATDAATEAAACGVVEDTDLSSWVEELYRAEARGELDETVAAMTLGSGNPVALADPQPGETVLDLGSGAGLDCLLASHRVGPEGRVIGVDLTPDMIALARANLDRVRARNVEFRLGSMEKLPVATSSVDAVISNCVINLSADKFAVFREAFRVLRPGGRFRVSDIVWTLIPTEEEKTNLASWAGCLAGALTVQQFTMLLDAAGFVDVRIEGRERPSGRRWMSAEISADKPL